MIRHKLGPIQDILNKRITVCSECGQACCWKGIFMCDLSKTAGTKEVPVYELVRLELEHPSYWEDEL